MPNLECGDGVTEGGLGAVQMSREALLQAAEALPWRMWVCHLPQLLMKAAKSPGAAYRLKKLPFMRIVGIKPAPSTKY